MARGEPGGVRADGVSRHGEDAYVTSVLQLPYYLTIEYKVVDAALGEIITTCSKLGWLIDHGEKALRPETRASNLILAYKSSKVHYEPLGVVAGIVSWNYRACLLAPPELSGKPTFPISAQCLVPHHCVPFRGERGRAEVLRKRGLVHPVVRWGHPKMPLDLWSGSRTCPGLLRVRLLTRVAGGSTDTTLQLVCCFPEQADALTRSPRIKHITFIGSETVGRKVRVL